MRASKAFTGRTAEETHTATNEPELPAATGDVLTRAERMLGGAGAPVPTTCPGSTHDGGRGRPKQ